MNKRVAYILIFFLSLINFHAFSSHYMGGEITWECLSDGNYRFTMKLYRECNGILYDSIEPLNVTNNPTLSNISLKLVSRTDISPVCNSAGPAIHCNPTPSSPNTGAIEEWLYTSDALYPNGVTLSGIPPLQGWIFSYYGCNRNNCQNLINASSLCWFLRAVMYPFNGKDANPCFDNSPTFAEKPSSVICTGYPYTYNHDAWDKDLDSLSYEWAQPLESAGTPISSYVPGYSYTSPLPGPAIDPNNVAATINSHTGEMSFTSFTQGAFVVVIKVTSYKCGVKVAENFREMQIVLLACGNNSPPSLTAPFPDNSGNYVNYIDTVYAGSLVTFTMTAADSGLLPDGSPQTIHMFASGSQFGTNYTSTTSGCLNPPCATLNPAPQPPPVGVSGQNTVQTNFSWQTDCSHLTKTCGTISNVYNFIIKAQDDFCPAPAISVATITIVVLSTPVLPPPELRCASVNANGSVTLTWKAVSDSLNSFNSYHIYSSNNAMGPFSEIDSIFNINQTTYTDATVNANNQSVYYYIETRSGCNAVYYSSPSDTLETILLKATNSGAGTAILTWNPLHEPDLTTSDGWYHIYKGYPPGTWTLIDSTQSLTYIDSIRLCNAFVSYYVSIDDNLPCTSLSSVDGRQFQDIIAPATPVIDSVSVDLLTGKSVIGWMASSSSDTHGYIIYEDKSGIWVPIDTVYGKENTYYVNNSSIWSNPDSSSLSYCIAAFDSCRNTSPISINQNTIFLTSSLDICTNEITLNWTPYVNMLSGLNGYNIYMRENNGPVTLLGTNTSANLTYTYSSITPNALYVFSVQAINSAGVITSTSNSDTILAHVSPKPQFVYLRYATVRSNDHVEIKAIIDTSGYISKCRIMRSDYLAGPYNQVGTSTPLPLSNIITYKDFSANVNSKSYYYKIIIVDSCGYDVDTSNVGRTIYLVVEPTSNMTNNLSWNDYEDWLGSVQSYNVFRGIDDVLDPNPLVTLPAGSTSYTDDVSSYTSSNGKFSYIIYAYEGPGNPYLCADTSISNEAVAIQLPRFYVPNAFVPSGVNNIFIPVNVFVNTGNYVFTIYDRWGSVVFQTNDTKEGWNGKYQNSPAPSGVYVYHIKYKDEQGEYIEKYGTVTLLR